MSNDEQTIYAVTQGRWSEYWVVAIYESRVDAEAEVAKRRAKWKPSPHVRFQDESARERYWDDYGYRVEEFTYHPATDTPIRPIQPASSTTGGEDAG